jgi:hypothetical protein
MALLTKSEVEEGHYLLALRVYTHSLDGAAYHNRGRLDGVDLRKLAERACAVYGLGDNYVERLLKRPLGD